MRPPGASCAELRTGDGIVLGGLTEMSGTSTRRAITRP
jgi:hypothetical protein